MRRVLLLALVVGTAAVLAASPASGGRDTVYVPGPLDLTIQDGLDLAVTIGPGTIVMVSPGTYSSAATGETFPIVMRSGIILRSQNGPSSTYIDADQQNRVMTCVGLGPGTAIEGFTLLEGDHPDNGGGVRCVDSTVEFLECVFLANEATYYGGGMSCDGYSSVTMTECEFQSNEAWSDISSAGGAVQCGGSSTLELVDCRFEDNWAFISGGALSLSGPSVVIDGCIFAGNSAHSGGAIRSSAESLTLSGCTLAENLAHPFEYSGGSGGALYLGSGDVVVQGCTLADNRAQAGGFTARGGAIYCYPNADLTLENTIIAFSTEGEAVYWEPPVAMICCDVYGNAGGPGAVAGYIGTNGNIAEDPLFCRDEHPAEPYRLQLESPCAEENNPACGQIGAWEAGCDFFAMIEIYIEWLEYIIGPDDVLCQPFLFGNVGQQDLVWELEVTQLGRRAREDGAELAQSSDDQPSPAPVEARERPATAKNEPQSGHGSSPLRGSGGPDAFGYVWTDSDEPGGPDFEWYDIQSAGYPLDLGNDGFAYIQLPFTFPFYGNEKYEMLISANGYLTFSMVGDEYMNMPIPEPAPPNDVIAPFWDDLDPSWYGTIHYHYSPDLGAVIVQYTGVAHYEYSGTGEYTFQVILYRDGTIVFQYALMFGDVDSATIGIEDGEGTTGLQIVYNAPYVRDELAVRIEAGGLNYISAFPTSGVLLPGGVQEIEVCVSSENLEPWNFYDAALLISSNAQNNPELTVPITIWVYPTGVEEESAPKDLVLHGTVPNPFNPQTEIRFGLPETADVSLRVYDAAGRLVRVLADDLARQPGAHSVPWDGRDDSGRRVASGVYFCRLEANGEMVTGRMLLLK